MNIINFNFDLKAFAHLLYCQRLLWIVAVTLSGYFCGASIREIVIDWYQN